MSSKNSFCKTNILLFSITSHCIQRLYYSKTCNKTVFTSKLIKYLGEFRQITSTTLRRITLIDGACTLNEFKCKALIEPITSCQFLMLGSQTCSISSPKTTRLMCTFVGWCTSLARLWIKLSRWFFRASSAFWFTTWYLNISKIRDQSRNHQQKIVLTLTKGLTLEKISYWASLMSCITCLAKKMTHTVSIFDQINLAMIINNLVLSINEEPSMKTNQSNSLVMILTM